MSTKFIMAIIKSDRTGHNAAHKGSVLHKIE
jgi:hypothetical protein